MTLCEWDDDVSAPVWSNSQDPGVHGIGHPDTSLVVQADPVGDDHRSVIAALRHHEFLTDESPSGSMVNRLSLAPPGSAT